jgi:hypothetical protein
MLQIQGVKGAAVVAYCKPLPANVLQGGLTIRRRRTSAEDAVSSAFPKGKQHAVFWISLDFTAGDIQDARQKRWKTLVFLSFHTFRRVVYATVGFIEHIWGVPKGGTYVRKSKKIWSL